jgi:flagellar motor switch protein FliM
MGHENTIPSGDTFFDPEIMEGMPRETFGLESETVDSPLSGETDICQKLDAVLERSLLPIADRLSAYLRLILMQVLPRQLQIEFKHQFQITYQDLTQLFPRRSYFSMIWVQPHNTVWFMHLNRSLAEGLAGRKYNLEFGSSGKRWHEVTDADSGIYLEIGEILRRCFHGIPRSWSQKGNLEIDRFKHMLQPGHLDEVEPEDLYVVQEFQINHPELCGCLHLGIPYVVIMSLLRDELAA